MNKLSTKTILVVTLCSLFLLGCSSGNSKKDRRDGPPPEAYKACEEKQAGDKVSFSGFRGETLEASCKLVDGKLVAEPTTKPSRRAR